jgi:hypothetical protein
MPERVEFGVPVAALQGATEPGDRFVYSYWFAGLSNRSADGRPVLTKPQWIYLAKAAGLDGELVQQWESWHTDNPAAAGRESALPALGHTYRSVRAEERADPYDAVLRRPEPDLLLELARSEVGLLFLDRTRLRPAGFVVGEHLHTLGLAPAEEVVLEQRSFYQREQLAGPSEAVQTLRELVPTADEVATMIGRAGLDWFGQLVRLAPDATACGRHVGTLAGRVALELLRAFCEPDSLALSLGLSAGAALEISYEDEPAPAGSR